MNKPIVKGIFVYVFIELASVVSAQTNKDVSFIGNLNSIPESSGLMFAKGKLWTFGDSGNPASIYSIDTANGNVEQTINITNYPNKDWEDITADDSFIYISDAGNNNGDRTNLRILKIAQSDIGNDATVSLTAQAISFTYADQTNFLSNPNTNFDCEAIINIGDTLYLFTKDRSDYQTRVYKLPKIPGTYKLKPYTAYDVNGKITGADYNPVTNEIVLIGYMGSKLNSFIWLLDKFPGDQFFSGNKQRIEIGSDSISWQTEGITYIDANRLYISCETTSQVKSSLYTLHKRNFKSSDINSIPLSPSEVPIKYYPNPADKFIRFISKVKMNKIEIENNEGLSLFATSCNNNEYTLPLCYFNFSSGIHYVKITTNISNYAFKIILIKK
jgi:hypothetical protein